MSERGQILKDVMSSSGVTQSELSRLSGVHQPSISQFLSGRTELSDDMLGRLLECLGFQLEVSRRAVPPQLTRSERRSWLLHRQLSRYLTATSLVEWLPRIDENVARLRSRVRGEPHNSNINRWADLIERRDLVGIRHAMNGLDRSSIEMREVSPLAGLLSEDERQRTLARL